MRVWWSERLFERWATVPLPTGERLGEGDSGERRSKRQTRISADFHRVKTSDDLQIRSQSVG